MVVDDTRYALSSNNFIPIETEKHKIILAHSSNHDMRHVIGWRHRYNGFYKKTAPYTVTANGNIYKHFDPKYYANYFNASSVNTKSIVIILENDGWLIKDSNKDRFLTWLGDIYNGPIVGEKKWRGQNYWAPYTEEQLLSVVELVKSLCLQFDIPLKVIAHNTRVDNLADYRGILYRSNLERNFTDLSPSWEFELFKNKIEN